MGSVRAFLDANVLFSAALGGPAFALLWELAGAGRVRLVTSVYCHVEAERNLERKYPARLSYLATRMQRVLVVPDVRDHVVPGGLLAQKDVPVYAAAVAARAAVLLTGDTKHFSHLMERSDLPLRVMTVARFLRTGY
ncbi:MAG TPA: PIN domain-containing protein [Trueperaceae bacterium]|nr:PIN domain-containing protein [Trueperaceae bacterium]